MERKSESQHSQARNSSQHTSSSQEQFQVESIVGRKKDKKLSKKFGEIKWLYKVHWLGFDSSEDSWEPEDNLTNCTDLLEQFLEDLKEKRRLYHEYRYKPLRAGARTTGFRKRSEDERSQAASHVINGCIDQDDVSAVSPPDDIPEDRTAAAGWCDLCKKTVLKAKRSRSNGLLDHYFNLHALRYFLSLGIELKCTKCSETIKNSSQIREHFADKHTNVGNFEMHRLKLDICKKFSNNELVNIRNYSFDYEK